MYGLAVVIAHERGVSTLYGHLSDLDVYGGQTVESRAVIGHCGSTGRSTGPHLHLEFRRNGVHYDPIAYLR